MTDDRPYFWHRQERTSHWQMPPGTRPGWMKCFLSPLVADVVLPVLMQRQAPAVLVSLQWRCHRFSSLTSWGSSFGLVGVHCQVVDVPLVRQRQVPTAFRVHILSTRSLALFALGPWTLFLRAHCYWLALSPGVLAPVHGDFWKNFRYYLRGECA